MRAGGGGSGLCQEGSCPRPPVSSSPPEMPGAQDKLAGAPKGHPVVPGPPPSPPATDPGRAAAPGCCGGHRPRPAGGRALDQASGLSHAVLPAAPPRSHLMPGDQGSAETCPRHWGALSALIHKYDEFQPEISLGRGYKARGHRSAGHASRSQAKSCARHPPGGPPGAWGPRSLLPRDTPWCWPRVMPAGHPAGVIAEW